MNEDEEWKGERQILFMIALVRHLQREPQSDLRSDDEDDVTGATAMLFAIT
jgi:hypothetical protein